MSGNAFGRLFSVTTWGESHGPTIGAIVDGCPPGLALSESDIQFDLDRRKPGQSRHVTQRKESDTVQIVSGVFEGHTTGTPIGLVIENQDQRSKDYSKIADRFRPNHADYAYQQKYGVRDYRGGGRSSARQTAMRVAAGAIAKKWLKQRYGVAIRACITQIGAIHVEGNAFDWSMVESNDFFWPNAAQCTELDAYLVEIRRQKDSVGARVEVEATGLPPGWGEPIFDSLDADIAHALMSINAAKAVSIGDGFDAVAQRGSEHRD
ncbi:MAG: chorismate synthase, partial [Pseudomonadota bacterium]